MTKNRRFLDRADRRRRVLARVFALLTLLSGAYYIVWAVGALNPAHPIVGTLFLTAEICCLGLFVITSVGVWRLRYKPEEGVGPGRTYSVDIFVPVCGEPLPMVRTTLEAIQAVRWSGDKRVYVLDDGASDSLKALTGQLGFTYLSRAGQGVPQENAKAGNLNFGLARTSGELILVMDADQVAVPHILEALAGYMRFPKVAFVQSKQSFVVPEDDPFFNSDRVFYEALQLGLDGGDAVISCGSGVLYRRAALEQIGGFATWNLVEDLTSSYTLHAAGWKSFYYPHALSIGTAPPDIWGVYHQRSQWALDTMRLFFWDSPLFKKGLRWFTRASYFIIGLTYLCSAFIFPFFFVVPVWSYLTGGNVFNHHELEFALVRSIYFVCMALALQYLFRRRQPGKQFQMLTGLFPVYARGAIRALAYPPGRKPRYRPTNQAGAATPRARIWAVLPQLILLAANALLPFYAIVQGQVPGRLIAMNIAISALAIWSLLAVILAAFHTASPSPAVSPERIHGTAI